MVSGQRDMLTAILGISWFWFVGATFLQLFPGYTCDVLGGGPAVVILLLCTFTIGIAGGSWFSAYLGAGKISLSLAPLGAAGMALSAFLPVLMPPSTMLSAGITSNLTVSEVAMNAGNWPSLIGFLGLALSGGVFVVPLFAFVQRQSPPQRRARVIAAANVLNALFMVLSALLTVALLKSGLKIVQIFALTGAMTAVVMLVMLIASSTMRADFAQRFCHFGARPR
jgi:hypothetical protein